MALSSEAHMTATRPRTGRQLAAARVLAGITQEQLAERAGLHVNSIRYMERQGWITTGHSSGLVAEALANARGGFLYAPHMRHSLKPARWRGVSRLIVVGRQFLRGFTGFRWRWQQLRAIRRPLTASTNT